ncbi:MAG: diaminohydroxyphosphoribosylaminopyrimidine deaminase [Alphaproteobacteria bacterium]|jgi:diaminohydroxyphosphoribosylaminopyrimidine deaminase/5-amino-6-(5-phosphoribosylamino)uracil reductase
MTYSDDQHRNYMRHALTIAKRHAGLTAKNPSVGCVILKDHKIIGRGVTGKNGRPHAETIALEQAGIGAKDANIYVTLEPCSHYGKTPPCANALIKAGVKNVFIGIQDPDERVSGAGISMLNQAKINTHIGLLASDIERHHAPFLTYINKQRPFYTLKFAASLDGRINFAPNMIRKKISTPFNHAQAHQLRQSHHAIAVGIGTMIDDNPKLTCRLKGLEHDSPDIIIFDNHCRINPQADIFSKEYDNLKRRIFVFHAEEATPKFQHPDVIYAPIAQNFDSIHAFLLRHHIYSVLIEGGATLQTAFLNAGLADNIIAFTGHIIIGGQAKAAFGAVNNPISVPPMLS